MKKSILTFIVILFFQVITYGQKWHLERINKESKYKYEYWFNFQNEDDTNTVEIIYTPSKELKRIISSEIFDRNDQKISFANMQIRDTNNNIEFYLTPDIDGRFIIDTKIEVFELKVYQPGFDKLSIIIKLKQTEDLFIKIKLGLCEELGIYQLDSKRELKPEEITNIINCVKTNRDNGIENYLKMCEDLKLFRINQQI